MSGNSPRKPEDEPQKEVDWLLLDADWLIPCDPGDEPHTPGGAVRVPWETWLWGRAQR